MIEFKDDYTKAGWDKLHPITKAIVESIARWSMQFDNKPLVLTETVSTSARDKKLGRVSPSHTEGRAVDIRTRDMSKDKLLMLMQTFGEKYKEYGYINKSGVRRIMLYHDSGHGAHIHLAIGLDVIAKNKNKYPEWKQPNLRS